MGVISTRLATSADALSAVGLIRNSIIELCEADHQHHASTLERWLRNKTQENFEAWCADLDNCLLAADLDSELAGVALLHRSGELRLFYVSPAQVGSGVGRALLCAIEAQARDWALPGLNLKSTFTARHFYERCGFTAAGEPNPVFGILLGYPYAKTL